MPAVSDIVLADFIERLWRPSYMHQMVDYVGPGNVGSYVIPDVETPSVITAPVFDDPEILSPIDFPLLLNIRRQSNVNIDDLQRRQILGGNYTGGTFRKLFNSLMGQIEDTMWDAIRAAAFSAGANSAPGDGGNIINAANGTLTTAMIDEAMASLDAPGILDMMFFSSPGADPILRSLYRDQLTAVQPVSPMLGVTANSVSINSIPLMKSHALPKTWRQAFTASAVSGGTFTFTVPVGHGLQVGMRITTTGATNNITTAAAITAVTATTVTADSGAATDASNGAGIISTNASVIVLGDRDKMHFAGDAQPSVREVQVARYAGANALQAYCTFGRLVIDGFVRIILVPN